jgi:hypothetical protein
MKDGTRHVCRIQLQFVRFVYSVYEKTKLFATRIRVILVYLDVAKSSFSFGSLAPAP